MQKKENKPITVRLAIDVYDKLVAYCEKSGQNKTVAIERAITMLAEDYEEKTKILEKHV